MTTILIVICIGVIVGISESMHKEDENRKGTASMLNILMQRYRNAATEIEKRNICIEAIDRKIIDRGVSIAVIDQLFDTDYSTTLPEKYEYETGVIHFAKQPVPDVPDDSYATDYVGWYLAFSFSCTGKIVNYHLSNLHK
ncbi:MAG: hypothetical protein ACYC26_15055 [Phycisphaerales bacterium]